MMGIATPTISAQKKLIAFRPTTFCDLINSPLDGRHIARGSPQQSHSPVLITLSRRSDRTSR